METVTLRSGTSGYLGHTFVAIVRCESLQPPRVKLAIGQSRYITVGHGDCFAVEDIIWKVTACLVELGHAERASEAEVIRMVVQEQPLVIEEDS